MCKNIIRPIADKMNFEKGNLRSGYGKDMVIVIPFTCEVRVKSVCMIGGDDGEAPTKLRLYKNEEAVDINIQEEKKSVQDIELNEGENEYPVNMTKFNNVSNLVLGIDGSFGGSKSALKFLGIKGERLRNKVKVIETVYEVRANLADH